MIVVVLLFIFIVNFSSVESRYECVGELTFEGETTSKTIYIKIQEYRWWVGLWSDTDGNIQLEIPNETLSYYSNLKEVGDQLQIFGADMNPAGSFSTLSKALTIDTGIGIFDGKCERISD